MTFPLLNDHFAEPTASTGYYDLINTLQKACKNPEKLKGRPQR